MESIFPTLEYSLPCSWPHYQLDQRELSRPKVTVKTSLQNVPTLPNQDQQLQRGQANCKMASTSSVVPLIWHLITGFSYSTTHQGSNLHNSVHPIMFGSLHDIDQPCWILNPCMGLSVVVLNILVCSLPVSTSQEDQRQLCVAARDSTGRTFV